MRMFDIKTTEYQLILNDENGEEAVYNVLFTVSLPEFSKQYVIYYLESSEDEDDIDLIASSYTGNFDEEDCDIELSEIETDEEWDKLDEALKEYSKSFA